jgi:GxxExxY protein
MEEDLVNYVNPVKHFGFLNMTMNADDLTQKIIGCAYKVHNTLGPGFLEKVYENALRIELEKLGLRVKQQEPINVSYEGQVIGEYYADLWINECVMVELKALQTIVKQHEVQLVNYLAATNIDTGLLLNFGPSVQVKRKFREYKPKAPLLNSIL